MRLWKGFLLSGAMFLGASVSAATIEEADALFDRRGELYTHKDKTFEQRSEIAYKAMAAYKELLAGTVGAERAYIGGRIARLYIYIGDYLMPFNNDSQRRIHFAECQDFMENKMKDSTGAEHKQTYYYGKAACWAFKLEKSSIFVKLKEKDALEKLAYEGVNYAYGNQFLGGAIRRSVSAVRASEAAISIGAGDVKEALKQAQKAFETPENDMYNRHKIAGEQFCDNYRFMAKAYLADPKSKMYSKEAAADLILEAFDAFEVDGTGSDFTVGYQVPGIEVDNYICIERLFDLVNKHKLEI